MWMQEQGIEEYGRSRLFINFLVVLTYIFVAYFGIYIQKSSLTRPQVQALGSRRGGCSCVCRFLLGVSQINGASSYNLWNVDQSAPLACGLRTAIKNLTDTRICVESGCSDVVCSPTSRLHSLRRKNAALFNSTTDSNTSWCLSI